MSSRGLPGFLRRTRRRDFDEEAEDYFSSSHHSINDDTDDVDEKQESSLARKRSNASSFDSSDTADNADDAEDDENDKVTEEFVAPVQAETEVDPSKAATDASNNPLSTDTHESGGAATFGASNASLGMSSLGSPRLDRRMSYREIKFDSIFAADNVKMADLRRLGWNGIPREYRGIAWKIMLGYLPTNASRRTNTLKRKRSEYKDAIAQHYAIDDNSRMMHEQETLRQVLVDVPRTAPEIPLFRNERIKRILGRLLYIWAVRHPASSYVQGMNDLATPLVVVFLSDYYEGEDVLDGNVMVLLSEESLDEVEADVYWCLTNILAGIQDHYTADLPGVQRMVMRLEELITRIDGNLAQHFADVGIQFTQFAFQWMTCLLLREFNLRCVIRLWDTYIAEDGFEDFHVYVCAAFLCQFSAQLQEMDFDELFTFMQKVPTEDWGDTEIEMLLSQAYVLSTLFGGSEAHLSNGK
eukprot:scaffold2557_cov121-Cylindrotheca_fusiformis.AAC.29